MINMFKRKLASNVITEGLKNIFNSIESSIEVLPLETDEKIKFKNTIERQRLEAEKLNIRVKELEQRQRKSLNETDDSSLQKIFAFSFLIGYFALLFVILLIVFGSKVASNFEDWQIAFISTIFGNMSMKVGTITDFLFGGSKKQNEPSINTDDETKE